MNPARWMDLGLSIAALGLCVMAMGFARAWAPLGWIFTGAVGVAAGLLIFKGAK